MASNPSLKRPQRVVRVGKFEVMAHIATGGMGAVYRAVDTENGLEYALKVLTPEMAAKPAMLERFRREARSAAKLQHENIVRVYDFAEYKGTYYIVMEFVDGVDLADHIERNGLLDPEETRQIMIQACRALKQAHAQAIVHRDIKPSNFLLTKKSGRQVVKLTDFGLAREVTNEECRVTRAGTTVGTVDYLSPEQARESSSADIRSDLYSLGCTWFHMLTGQPPFEGGLAERILKHLEEAPPDVRQFNPRASKALVAILNKMLEKNPRDRYQTPAELLDELVTLFPVAKSSRETSRPSVAGDKRDDPPTFTSPSKRTASKRKGKSTRRDGETVADRRDTVETLSPRRLWIGGTIAAGILLVSAVVLAITLKWILRGGPADLLSTPSEPNGQPTLTNFLRPDGLYKLPPAVKPEPIVKPAPLPTLLPPEAPPLDVARLRERLGTAFPNQPAVLREQPVRVQRTAGGETTACATLAEALAKAPADRPATIEIEDNGPFFWSTTAFAGRDVTVGAAKGYRPLIVWDVDKTIQERGKTPGKPWTFLTVERGRLTLQGVDVVLQAPDSFKDPLTLVQATDADFSARDCTFSVSGRSVNPLVVAHFVATKPEKRCRFSNCVLRGNSLQALDLDAPGGLVLFENCLAAGGEFPLLQMQGNAPAASVFAVRSTLVGSAKLLRLQGGDNSPSLNWFAWDSILSRSNDKLGGEMIVLPIAGTTEKIKWESVNTLYAGWQTLLTGVERVSSENGSAWRRLMQVTPQASERAIPDMWPAAQTELSEVSAGVFRTARTPVAFVASVNNQETIGCVLDQLPPLRDNWKSLAYERFLVDSFDILEDAPVTIPPANSGKFTGQVLDLSTEDLGLFLQKMQEMRGFGPRVVMHLRGTGCQPMTPVKLKGVQLVLYFEPQADDSKRLSLTLPAAASAGAMLEIEDGGLDISNGEFALPDSAGRTVTGSLFKVSGGNLRLSRCRLHGPQLTTPPANYRGLIEFAGSGDVEGKKGRQCILNESVLVTRKTAVAIHGVGAHLLARQSVILTDGPALALELGAGFKGRANMQCVLTSSTLATRQSVVQVEDAVSPEPTVEPIVIQSMQCAFQAPFKDTKPEASVLRFGGEALTHGLFMWQSDADLFDKRFSFGCLPLNIEAPKPPLEWHSAWLNLFGTGAVTRMKIDPTLSRQIDATKNWGLEHLLLTPPKVWPDKLPTYGADLAGKDFVKKPKGG